MTPSLTAPVTRIQRRRTKGWRMPEGAVYVGRPSRWGNPFPITGAWIEAACLAYGYRTTETWRRAMAVALYRWWMTGAPVMPAVGEVLLEWPIQLTEGVSGKGSAWIPNHGVIDLPRRPDLAPLQGKTIVCWCPLEDAVGLPVPCHADVLAELVG